MPTRRATSQLALGGEIMTVLRRPLPISYPGLSKMKNGHISAIRFSTLAAICEVLHCQPGDILEYDPVPAEEK